jgi:hypothetical protein
MGRAYSIQQILDRKHKTLEWSHKWREAFTLPETTGIWFVWGNSGNGKSSFIMQMVRELANTKRVLINELEEGSRLTFQETVKRTDIASVKRNVIVTTESLSDLTERLKKHKSPEVVVINTVQYLHDMKFPDYLKYRNEFQNTKLTIFNSHAEGKHPVGRTAKQIKYDADLKLWIEGFHAISNGRYNPGGRFVIDEVQANKYWGMQSEDNNQNQ